MIHRLVQNQQVRQIHIGSRNHGKAAPSAGKSGYFSRPQILKRPNIVERGIGFQGIAFSLVRRQCIKQDVVKSIVFQVFRNILFYDPIFYAFRLRIATPMSGSSSPTIHLTRVDFSIPLLPTRLILSPAFILNETPSRILFPPSDKQWFSTDIGAIFDYIFIILANGFDFFKQRNIILA
jgi:hypothetical protein